MIDKLCYFLVVFIASTLYIMNIDFLLFAIHFVRLYVDISSVTTLVIQRHNMRSWIRLRYFINMNSRLSYKVMPE